jgi:GAF domain-containing protein
LPLILSNKVIGVLDVQSDQPAAFTDEDLELLTILADQVSIAILNARQFQETQKALAEAQIIYRQYVHSEWKSISEERQNLGYRYSSSGMESLEKPTSLVREKQSSQSEQSGNQMTIPIKLHGQVIGMLNVKSSKKGGLGQDELDIARSVSERVALSIENAHLLQTSQAQAAKERIIGEISSKISAAASMDNILKTAVGELGNIIPDTDIFIQITSDQEPEE